MSGWNWNTRHRSIALILLLLLAASLAAPDARILAEGGTSTSPMDGVVAGNSQFAWELYRQVAADPENQGANIFFSPYSVSAALAMTYAGSCGDTAAQMARVLHFPSSQEDLHQAFAALIAHLGKTGAKGYQLKMANALWGQRDYHFETDFLALVTAYYRGGFRTVDYVGEPQRSVETINQWVAQQTADKIKDLLRREDISSLTRLILTNAIYFKGDWAMQFKPEETRTAPFAAGPGRTVDIPLMHQIGEFGYVESGGAQILELPYAGKDLAMLVLLPVGDLGRFEAGLTAQRVREWQQQSAAQKVEVYLPRFKFGTRYYLDRILPELGMSDAFSQDRADFSGITGSRDLYIKHVIHQAVIDVNEQGSEAAAATAVVMNMKSARLNPIFRADRPFIFAIVHQPTGSLLFLGRVANPAQG